MNWFFGQSKIHFPIQPFHVSFTWFIRSYLSFRKYLSDTIGNGFIFHVQLHNVLPLGSTEGYRWWSPGDISSFHMSFRKLSNGWVRAGRKHLSVHSSLSCFLIRRCVSLSHLFINHPFGSIYIIWIMWWLRASPYLFSMFSMLSNLLILSVVNENFR